METDYSALTAAQVADIYEAATKAGDWEELSSAAKTWEASCYYVGGETLELGPAYVDGETLVLGGGK